MPAAPPSAEELAPLLGESNSLDDEATDPYEGENVEFMSAARAAVGSDQKAMALRDAFEAYCREKGLIQDEPDEMTEMDEPTDVDVGEGFPDL